MSAELREQLRIGLLSDADENAGNGVGTYTATLARGLAELGHRVHWITWGWERPVREQVDGVTLHKLPVPEPSYRRGTATLSVRFYQTRQRLVWCWKVARALNAIRVREGLDVLESPEYHSQSLLVHPAAGRPRLPTVVKLHAPSFMLHELNRRPGSSLPVDMRITDRLERVAAGRARLLTAPSASLADELAVRWRLDRAAIRVVPNPFDDDVFRPFDGPPRRRDDLLFVGRIDRQKGIDTLVDAMPRVAREVPGAKVTLVGRDTMTAPGDASMVDHVRERWRSLGLDPSSLQLEGQVERAAMPAIYSRHAIYVVPSLYESLSFTCIEAMACGCAVVANAVGGIPEFVTDGVDGLLVPPGDPRALAEAVTRLMRDPALARRLGQRARETAVRRFGRSSVCEETVATYRSAIGGAVASSA